MLVFEPRMLVLTRPPILRRRMRRWIPLALAGLIVSLAGCGSTAGKALEQNATLVLDFTPNAIHAGIYSAIAHGFDKREGVHLHVIVPSASTDSIRLLESGRVNFAILDIHDLAIARERGADIVGVMAVVERPLAAVIAAPQIRDPRELDGKTVGITGDPSDSAVLDSIVAGSGGDPRKVKTITIGFDAVAALLSGRVAAATAFWNDEGVTIQQRRPGFHVFRVDDFGAPAYPELVLCATRATLQRDPSLARGVVRALLRGYGATLGDPKASEANLESRVPGLDPRLLHAELTAVEPSFETAGERVGVLDPATLRAWARWEVRFGIVRRLPDVRQAFDSQFGDGAASAG
jgi:putative hydroxymethylpyrimidine transport system substrate-binding protein